MNTLTQATKHTYVNTRTTGHVNLYATASHTSHVCVHDSSLESQQRINHGTTSLQFTCCGNNFMCTASSSIVSSKKTLKHNGTVQWWDERVRVETYRQEQERCNRSFIEYCKLLFTIVISAVLSLARWTAMCRSTRNGMRESSARLRRNDRKDRKNMKVRSIIVKS